MPRITLNVALILVAVVSAAIGALGGFHWWDWAERYEAGWLATSLACGWASFVAWGSRPAT
jgi:hypothetical protein